MKRGGARLVQGRLYARARYGKDDRLEVRVPWATSREQAAERGEILAQLADKLVDAGRRDLVKSMAQRAAEAATLAALVTVCKAVDAIVAGVRRPVGGLVTFKDVADDWISGKLRERFPDHVRSKADWRGERARLTRYIYPHVKDVPVSAFTRAHADLVMSRLPAKRVKSQATRRHVAQIMARVLNLAVMPLGVIAQSPLPRGWLPRIETRRHYTCLFPREEAALIGCASVNEGFRLFCGVLNREGMRVSELADSEWWQWNLVEGTFTATRTKTGDPRMWALRPDTLQAMQLWAKRCKSERPFSDVVPDEKAKLWLATRLREALAAAGVERRELFDATAHTGKLRTHDLRATFVTLSLAEGRSETWIRDRTAHKTLSMIDRYRRASRQVEELKLGSLVDLVEGLGWGTTRGMKLRNKAEDAMANKRDDEGFRRKDSNLRKRNQNPQRGRERRARGTKAAEIGTIGVAPEPGIPQASPTLMGLVKGLADQRAVWDLLDEWGCDVEREVGS